jgi:hypothetical protein
LSDNDAWNKRGFREDFVQTGIPYNFASSISIAHVDSKAEKLSSILIGWSSQRIRFRGPFFSTNGVREKKWQSGFCIDPCSVQFRSEDEDVYYQCGFFGQKSFLDFD